MTAHALMPSWRPLPRRIATGEPGLHGNFGKGRGLLQWRFDGPGKNFGKPQGDNVSARCLANLARDSLWTDDRIQRAGFPGRQAQGSSCCRRRQWPESGIPRCPLPPRDWFGWLTHGLWWWPVSQEMAAAARRRALQVIRRSCVSGRRNPTERRIRDIGLRNRCRPMLRLG